MTVRIYHADIFDLEVDAIVNAANTSLDHVDGLAAAMVRRGGRVIQDESDRLGHVDFGDAVLTGAGALKAQYVIHIPTVRFPFRRATLAELEASLRHALGLAEGISLRSVAFPLLGTGLAGMPLKSVLVVMLAVFREFPKVDITLCVHFQDDISPVWELVERENASADVQAGQEPFQEEN
jgi:O-acetyl-ADP-ribose deacetylase (regulator of RNase III)